MEIDTDTGHVALLRHVIVDDNERIISPLLPDGQVHGAAAQGIGQALMEGMAFSGERDALVAGFDDYAMPHAGDLPAFETGHTVSSSPSIRSAPKGSMLLCAPALAPSSAILQFLTEYEAAAGGAFRRKCRSSHGAAGPPYAVDDQRR